MKKEDIEKLLSSTQYNSKGDNLCCTCPYCGKENHFYINVNKAFKRTEDGNWYGSWVCKKCNEKGSIKKLLKHFNKEYLLTEGETVQLTKLVNKIKVKKELLKEPELDLTLPNKKLPIGFIRLMNDAYLRDRGFRKREFMKYTIGKSILSKYKGYIIISIEEDGVCKGFIARSTLSKEMIKVINTAYKRKGWKRKYLRYQNSQNTDFSKMLFGYDEIGFATKSVILVEGIFDKIRTEQKLNLNHNIAIKCCATFGKSISQYQIQKLKRKNIKEVILIQDPDAIKESKQYAFELKKHFKSVLVGFTGKKDLGDSNRNEILKVMGNLMEPEEFFLMLEKKVL